MELLNFRNNRNNLFSFAMTCDSMDSTSKNSNMLRVLWGLIQFVFYGLWKDLVRVSICISKGSKRRRRHHKTHPPLLPITTKHIQIKQRLKRKCNKNFLLVRCVMLLCAIAMMMFVGYRQSIDEQNRSYGNSHFEERVPVELLPQNNNEIDDSNFESESIELQSDVFPPSSIQTHPQEVINNEESEEFKPPNRIYDLSVKDIIGNQVNLDKFFGQVLMIVNVAMEDQYSESNFVGLQMLHQKYGPYGLQIFAFPSQEFIQWKMNETKLQQQLYDAYGVAFPLYEKVVVNGQQAHPLYSYIRQQLGYHSSSNKIFPWNFQKILVNRRGQIVKWFDRWFDQQQIETAVYDLLVEPLDKQKQ